MSVSHPSSDQSIDELVFGHAPRPDDWVRDIRSRLSVIFLDPNPGELRRFLTRRLCERANWAKPHFERVYSQLEGKTEGFLGEAYRLREVVDGALKLGDRSLSSTLVDALLAEVEVEAQEIADERRQLLCELNTAPPGQDQRKSDRITNAVRSIEQAMVEHGPERSVILREARGAVIEEASGGGVVHPGAWFLQGWTGLLLGQGWAEIAPQLARVFHTENPGLIGHFAARLLADCPNTDLNSVESSKWALRAFELHGSGAAAIEAGLSRSSVDESSEARPFFESALCTRSTTFIDILSDERSLSAASELFEVAVRVQMRLRQAGRQRASDWAAASRQVCEAQRICVNGCHVARDLLEGHAKITARIGEADLVTASFFVRTASEGCSAVVFAAREALDAEFNKRADAVSASRKAIDSAGAARDERIERALSDQEVSVQRATDAIQLSEREAENLQKGAFLGLGGGSGFFALYLLASGVLRSRGMEIGFSTPVGWCAIVVTIIPVLMGLSLQTSYFMKRFSMDAQLQQVVGSATLTYDRASKEADDGYREHVTRHKKLLEAAEEELKKVQQAQRFLGEPEDCAPRLAA